MQQKLALQQKMKCYSAAAKNTVKFVYPYIYIYEYIWTWQLRFGRKRFCSPYDCQWYEIRSENLATKWIVYMHNIIGWYLCGLVVRRDLLMHLWYRKYYWFPPNRWYKIFMKDLFKTGSISVLMPFFSVPHLESYQVQVIFQLRNSLFDANIAIQGSARSSFQNIMFFIHFAYRFCSVCVIHLFANFR